MLQTALASKNINKEVNNVFTKVTKVINYIKNDPFKARLFAKLCKNMGANYISLLYYYEVRWLSRAKVIQKVLELKEELQFFPMKIMTRTQIMFRDDSFIVKLTYLVEIFGKLSVFNKSMQGPQMHLLMQKDKVKKVFEKKLDLWKSNFQKIRLTCFHFLNYAPKLM